MDHAETKIPKYISVLRERKNKKKSQQTYKTASYIVGTNANRVIYRYIIIRGDLLL